MGHFDKRFGEREVPTVPSRDESNGVGLWPLDCHTDRSVGSGGSGSSRPCYLPQQVLSAAFALNVSVVSKAVVSAKLPPIGQRHHVNFRVKDRSVSTGVLQYPTVKRGWVIAFSEYGRNARTNKISHPAGVKAT